MMDRPDSALVERLDPGLGYRRGELAPRTRDPVGIVVHTTGIGPWRRWKAPPARWPEEAKASPTGAALHLYTRIMANSGHYLIGLGGEIFQIVPEAVRAHHVGSAGSAVYRTRPTGWQRAAGHGFGWWFDRWPGYRSPADLCGGLLWGGDKRSANDGTIGVEMVPPEAVRDPWPAVQVRALEALIRDIRLRRGPLPVITHADAHPIDRTTAGGVPWDPPPAQMAQLAGVEICGG